MNAEIGLLSAIAKFAAEHRVIHALLTTFNFDGQCLEGEEWGLLDSICRNGCSNVLVIRDRNQVIRERAGLRIRVVDAGYSTRVFHTKLAVLVADDALFAAVGSANLTRGGLRTNLELVRPYELGATGPVSLFSDIKQYLDKGLRRELTGTRSVAGGYDELLRDMGELIDRAKPDAGPEPRLLHNYDQPLYEQILKKLHGRPVEQAWIVSPFFEEAVDGKPDDPDSRGEEYAVLFEQLLEDLKLTGTDRKPVRVYFQPGMDGTTNLPVNALKRHRGKLELWAKNVQAIDLRRLHGKMLAFFSPGDGRSRPTATIVYGSPNFTPSALLRTPAKGGNAELAVVTTFTGGRELAEQLEAHYNLSDLFSKVEKWDKLKSAPKVKAEPFQRGLKLREGYYRLLEGEIDISLSDQPENAARIRAFLLAEDGTAVLVGEEGATTGQYTVKVPVSLTPKAGERFTRVGFNAIRVEVLAADGSVIASATGPVNIDCPELCLGNYAKTEPADDLDEEIYNYGLAGATSYQQLKDEVEKLEAHKEQGPATAGIAPLPEHQADLDQFFRNVHLGLRGMLRRLDKRSSPVAFRDVLRVLGRWSGEAGKDESRYSREQKMFLGSCLLESACEVRELMRRSGQRRGDVIEAVQAEFVTRAGTLSAFGREMKKTAPDLRENARGLLRLWNVLNRGAGKRGRDGRRD